MSTVDCQASANSQDDEEAGIIDKAERRRMKFPCPPGPTQAAESNESNKLHNNNNCSFQDGGKTTDPRSLLEGKLQVGIQLLALIMVKQIMHFVIKCVPFSESKNGFLILDLLHFVVERNVKSEIGFVTLAMHLSLETPTLGRYGALLGVCRGLCSVNWAEGMGN